MPRSMKADDVYTDYAAWSHLIDGAGLNGHKRSSNVVLRQVHAVIEVSPFLRRDS